MTIKVYYAKSSAKFTNADAKVIGPVLGDLAERGPVTARDVVDAAHSANSPLHSYFEWDDAKAADMHRLGVAREMVKTVRVRVISSAGSYKQVAAQPIVVRAPDRPNVRVAYSSSPIGFDDGNSEKDDALGKKSLDPSYYPETMDEACDLIDDLRERVNAVLGDTQSDGSEYGMTAKEAAIYRFLKSANGKCVGKDRIYNLLYGAGAAVEPKIIDVFVCKLRSKLPSHEKIETVWGQGYEFISAPIDVAESGSKRRFTDHAELQPEKVIGLPDDNAAVREGRTLFPSTVVAPADSPALLVSGENSRKLGSQVTKGPWSGFPIYQLSLEERASCPRSCFHWNTCYGNGMQMARRHKADADLIPYLRAELTDLQDEFPRGFVVRLHVLGDFFSEAYARQWIEWLREFPALHIFGYTAHTKDSPIGKILLAATDTQFDRFAIRFSSEEPQPQGATTIWRLPEDGTVREGIVCPAQTGKTDCCGTCGLCWAVSAKEKTIAFIAHGRASKTVEPLKAPTRAQMMGRR